ncbi:MAG: type II toxin-antitoxin system HicA family toxin [Longimicrobiales bacterium]
MKVRDLLRLLERNGWSIVRIRGSHRQLRHESRPGVLTVAGKPTVEIPVGTLKQS